MSNIISLGLLTQRREDAKKMETRAKELLKELNANSVTMFAVGNANEPIGNGP
jgi:hypothetical protein